MPRTLRHLQRLSLGTVIGLAAASPATAQVDGATTLERQTDEAFRQVLQQPQNLGQWSQYAKLLIEAGNYEGGIATLERLLLEPDAAPELRLDIAVLYYRLGSYSMAEAMLTQALADNRLQGDNRALAESLLADTRKRAKPNQLQGAVTLGLRHQTNPTYRTDAAQVFAGGVLVPVAANQRPDDDNDISLGLRLNHRFDLERQNSATIATNFGAYLVNYSSSGGSQLVPGDNKPYDLLLLDLNTGVEFKPAPDTATGLTLRPHVILANVVAKRHQYLRNAGLGVDLAWQPDERMLYEVTLDGVQRDFAQRADVTNADLQDGNLYSLRARVSRELAAGQRIVGEYAFRKNEAGRDFYDFESHEIRATYAISYASPFSKGTYWTTELWAGLLNRGYGGPDPAVSNVTRKDREWRFGVNQTVPLVPMWSLVLSAEHARNRANLPNYEYKNTSVSATVVRSF